MAWTKIIDEDEADSEPRALYGRPIDPESGRVDEIMRVHSCTPQGSPVMPPFITPRCVRPPPCPRSKGDDRSGRQHSE